MTLDEVLASSAACMKLYQHAQKEFSTENLDFILLVRAINPSLGAVGFLPPKGYPEGVTSPKDRARYLYDRFIYPAPQPSDAQSAFASADQEINIGSDIRERLKNEMEKGTLGPDSYTTATRSDPSAYSAVRQMLQKDTWRRFQLTKEGKEIVDAKSPKQLAEEAIQKLEKGPGPPRKKGLFHSYLPDPKPVTIHEKAPAKLPVPIPPVTIHQKQPAKLPIPPTTIHLPKAPKKK
jgi:hypothetical protein